MADNTPSKGANKYGGKDSWDDYDNTNTMNPRDRTPHTEFKKPGPAVPVGPDNPSLTPYVKGSQQTRQKLVPETGKYINFGRSGPDVPVDAKGKPRKPERFDKF